MNEDDLRDCWADLQPPRVAQPLDRQYQGRRLKNGASSVTVREGLKRARPLPMRQNVRNHSPTGFEWGYSGSGPAQLALAILMDAFGKVEEERALRLYQKFKASVIAALPRDAWTLTHSQVMDIVAELESKVQSG